MATHRAKPLCGIELNYEVVGGTTAPTSFKKENTIWINSDTTIKEHAFAYENPWVYYKDTDYIETSTIIQDKYLSTSGVVTDGDGDNAPCYTENYIPVKYGITYNINYTLSASKSMWCRIIEYTGSEGNYTFKGYNALVSSVTGTSQSKIYTPSAATVTAVRISWRTFYSLGTTCTFSFVEPDVEYNTASAGDIWIRTDIDKASASFNAIKKNELMIYPHRAKQWIGSKWKFVAANMLYKNGDSAEICAAEYELIESSVSQGGTLVELYAIRQGSYTPDVNNNGFVFKSKAGNAGSKTVYIPYDIRDFEKISVKGIHSGNSTIVSRSLVDIFVGTISQITGIDYDSEATKNGALSVYSGSGISGTINVEDIDITGITSVALEPVYIAIRCNSYYESAAEVHLSELTLE